jgi:hypothetical protein
VSYGWQAGLCAKAVSPKLGEHHQPCGAERRRTGSAATLAHAKPLDSQACVMKTSHAPSHSTRSREDGPTDGPRRMALSERTNHGIAQGGYTLARGWIMLALLRAIYRWLVALARALDGRLRSS